MLITSRPDNAIKRSFSTIANNRLRGEDETEAITEDVERVVQANINQLKDSGLPVELLTGLQGKLIKGADRTFLWTTLTITLLKNASEAGASKEDLDAIIENRDTDAVYECLLDAQPRDLRPAAFRMLQIVLAASRPLTLQEMSIVMELKGNQRRFKDVQKSIKHPFENYVRSLCGHFLRIIHSKIYLVHQTARTFLLDPAHHSNLSRPDYLTQYPSTSIDAMPQTEESFCGADRAHLAVEYLQARSTDRQIDGSLDCGLFRGPATSQPITNPVSPSIKSAPRNQNTVTLPQTNRIVHSHLHARSRHPIHTSDG